MTDSKKLAGLLGPAMIALGATEAMHLDIWEQASGPAMPPLNYFNGSVIFITGLAIVRAHNKWVLGWPVLVTLAGWFGIVEGLIRMIAPGSANSNAQHPVVMYVLFGVMVVAGIILTARAFGRKADLRATDV
jgi:hypothetical protein